LRPVRDQLGTAGEQALAETVVGTGLPGIKTGQTLAMAAAPRHAARQLAQHAELIVQ
jgi:hypothetical protein